MATWGSSARAGFNRIAVIGAVAVLLAGCGTPGGRSPLPERSPTAPATAETTTAGTNSGPETAAPSGAPPSGTPTPGEGGSPSSPGAAPLSCTSGSPVRVEKITTEPRRTTEVVTVVSDGRNLTPGTREQSDFGTPTLTAPDGTADTDEATMQRIAALIDSASRNRVLLTRPDPPDAGAEPTRRPYDAPGTYVLYNASVPLNADVIVDCSGQEQRWQFTAEGNPTTGVVNCAVQPPKSNAVARLVYTNNC